jgi:hypothetical protein
VHHFSNCVDNLKAAVEQDAWMHSMHTKCAIAVPLVTRSPASELRPESAGQNLLQHRRFDVAAGQDHHGAAGRC